MTLPKWHMITIPKRLITVEALIAILDTTCEDYVIGEEKGEKTGYEHYQCKICLKEDVAYNSQVVAEALRGAHFEVARVRDYSYCEKEGKFWRSWEKPLWKFLNVELRGWQAQVLKHIEVQDDRKITVVLDRHGATGKSFLTGYMQVNHICEVLPSMDKHKDLMRVAMTKKHAKGFVIDIPRAMNVRPSFWAAIEDVKNGHLWDDRYSFKERWIEPPKVLVFTNKEPKREALSADRWDIIEIGGGPGGI